MIYYSFNFSNYLLYFLLNKKQSNYRKIDLKDLLVTFIRISISFLIMEIVLHLTSLYSIFVYHKQLLAYFSRPSLAMALLLNGSLFASKYVVYYGVTTLANKMVGMKTTELPRCISLMHTNSEMWRYFDTGIYEFIKKYIFLIVYIKNYFKTIS